MYGMTAWELAKSMHPVYGVKKIVAKELNGELLGAMARHIPKYTPDAHFVDESNLVVKSVGRKPKTLENSHLVSFFKGIEYGDLYENINSFKSNIDDVLHGVCRLDAGSGSHKRGYGESNNLSKRRLFTLLTKVELISATAVMSALTVKERQAQRYMLACSVAQKMLLKEIDNYGVFNDDMLIEKIENKMCDDN